MKIAALTDHHFTPSSRFRVRSHISFLRKNGIYVADLTRLCSTQTSGLLFPTKKLRNSLPKLAAASLFEVANICQTFARVCFSNYFEATWISRQIINNYPSFEMLVKKPIIYDIDDAVYLATKANSGILFLIQNAAVVFACNSYLAEYCRQHNSNVHIVPTAVDVNRFMPNTQKKKSKDMIIGWSGTSSSYKYFSPIVDSIAKFLKGKSNIRLSFFSDRYPYELKQLHPYLDFEFWSPSLEADQIRTLDVGLMPIDNSEWSRGKCSYKMLLYAASGVPTICSNFGMNNELIKTYNIGLAADSPGDWYDHLEFCYRNKDCLQSIFPDCRTTVINYFSNSVIQEKIFKIFIDIGL